MDNVLSYCSIQMFYRNRWKCAVSSKHFAIGIVSYQLLFKTVYDYEKKYEIELSDIGIVQAADFLGQMGSREHRLLHWSGINNPIYHLTNTQN